MMSRRLPSDSRAGISHRPRDTLSNLTQLHMQRASSAPGLELKSGRSISKGISKRNVTDLLTRWLETTLEPLTSITALQDDLELPSSTNASDVNCTSGSADQTRRKHGHALAAGKKGIRMDLELIKKAIEGAEAGYATDIGGIDRSVVFDDNMTNSSHGATNSDSGYATKFDETNAASPSCMSWDSISTTAPTRASSIAPEERRESRSRNREKISGRSPSSSTQRLKSNSPVNSEFPHRRQGVTVAAELNKFAHRTVKPAKSQSSPRMSFSPISLDHVRHTTKSNGRFSADGASDLKQQLLLDLLLESDPRYRQCQSFQENPALGGSQGRPNQSNDRPRAGSHAKSTFVSTGRHRPTAANARPTFRDDSSSESSGDDYSSDDESDPDEASDSDESPTSSSSTISPRSDSTLQSVLSPVERETWEIVERAMDDVRALFAENPAYTVCAGPASAGPQQTQASVVAQTNNSSHSRPTGVKRARAERESSPPSDDDDIGTKRSKTKRGTSEEPRPRLACPFCKHKPQRYRNRRACAAPPGFKTVHRVKEHVYRKHAVPIHCIRCGTTFGSDHEHTEHMRQVPSCEVRLTESFEGCTKEQERQLRSRRNQQGLSEVTKWKNMYLILFPDEDPVNVPSPYYEEDPLSTESARFESLEMRIRRSVFQQVRHQLEQETRDFNSTIRNRVLGILREAQSNVATSLRRNQQSGSAAATPAQQEDWASALPIVGEQTEGEDPASLFVEPPMNDNLVQPNVWQSDRLANQPQIGDSGYGSNMANSASEFYPVPSGMYDFDLDGFRYVDPTTSDALYGQPSVSYPPPWPIAPNDERRDDATHQEPR